MFATFYPSRAAALAAAKAWADRSMWWPDPITDTPRRAESDEALFGPWTAHGHIAPADVPDVPDVPVGRVTVRAVDVDVNGRVIGSAYFSAVYPSEA